MDQPGRILGIDYGGKRVGLALTDPLRILAQGAGTLENDGRLLERIAGMVQDRGVTLIVVGMPYAPDGGRGEKGEEVQSFIGRLRGAVGVPIETWDESFTSVDAKTVFVAGGMKRKQRREKPRVDEMAARLLLQGYLENH
jgi:putative Holliday junction resolvase